MNEWVGRGGRLEQIWRININSGLSYVWQTWRAELQISTEILSCHISVLFCQSWNWRDPES